MEKAEHLVSERKSTINPLQVESLNSSLIKSQRRCKEEKAINFDPVSMQQMHDSAEQTVSAYDFALQQALAQDHSMQQPALETKAYLVSRKNTTRVHTQKGVFQRIGAIHELTEPIVFSRHHTGQFAEVIPRLITVEKLLVSQKGLQASITKLFNAFQLLTVYFVLGDYHRIIRYFDSEL